MGSSLSVEIPAEAGLGRPRYPFGMTGPFTGLRLAYPGGSGKVSKGVRLALDYTPNPKQYLAHNCCADEVLYGGSLGSGKSFLLLFHNAAHCLRWGQDAVTIVFRRTYDELKRSVLRDVARLFDGKAGNLRAVETQPVFEWNNGAITYFRHLQEWTDVEKHDSAQYTLICFDELTHFEERQYTYLFQRLRSPNSAEIQPQVLSATNPRGIGHKWVYDRFIKDKKPNTVYRYHMKPMRIGSVEIPATAYTRVFIPAVITDNAALMKTDGTQYLARLAQNMSPEEFDALVRGDWTVFMGRAFSEWDAALHVVEPFNVPDGWKVIRSLDWGYSAPFSVNWFAQNPETKAIYLVAEWYGGTRGTGGGVQGLKMSPRELRQNIVDRERAYVDSGAFPRPWYGKADPAIWKGDGMTCVADSLNAGGCLFTRADNNRVLGWQTIHGLLRTDPNTGKPGFVSFETCKNFNSQISKLVADEKNPEDVNTHQEDHSADSVRYGLVDLTQTSAAQRPPGDYAASRGGYEMMVAV